MFCSNCGNELKPDHEFCSNCGKETQESHDNNSTDQFGRVRVKSFVDYKNSIGKPSKASLNKGKITKSSNKDEKDVVIKIGLMVWDPSNEKLKERRAKRVALRVSTASSYDTLLKHAKEKWKNFWRNLYQEDKEYVLLLEDGQLAKFLPGTKEEAFNLKKYKEEVMKDYKRITFYLCTTEDLCWNESTCSQSEDENVAIDMGMERDAPDGFDDSAGLSVCSTWVPSTRTRAVKQEDPICLSDSNSDEEVKVAVKRQKKEFVGNNDATTCGKEDEIQIRSDEEFAMSLQSELDKEETVFTEVHQVISALEQKVISDGKDSVYVVVRRKAHLERKLKLWQRATSKVSPELILHVKFMGEDGIDTGALAKEFLTETISEIGEKFFPQGSPLHSTNDIYSGNFQACGELVAVSLAQGGPPPCFLDDKVYETLVTENVDFTSPNLVNQLTSKEEEMLNEIKSDVMKFQDTIIDHGYTGQINQENVESIVSSIVVSIMSKRTLCLNEFRRGLSLYGLAEVIRHNPQVAHPLFVSGQQKDVDADYVLSLLRPEFSEEGSSCRVEEENMMDYFQDFVMALEEDKVSGDSEALAWAAGDNMEKSSIDVENDEENEKFSTQDISPAGVLGWLTAVKHRELGTSFNRSIQVLFDHDCMDRDPNHALCFPIVGVCGRVVTLPVLHMNSSASFKHAFLLAMNKSQAFTKR